MWDKLFKSVDMLQNGLSASWTRNAVLRNNIANVETPNFKGSDVDFESYFAAALDTSGFRGKKTSEKHFDIGAANSDLSSVPIVVKENNDLSMRMDENNVDVEAENVKIAQNSIQYNTILTKLNGELARIKMAISESK